MLEADAAEIETLRAQLADDGEWETPAFEDDPVATALGFTPVKEGVLLPGTPEHCHRCALDEIESLRASLAAQRALADRLAEDLSSARDQWGDEYLWG